MGIGQKIKDALSTENEREPGRDDQLPGGYPEDEYAQKHSDGREHIPPHGTAVGDSRGDGSHLTGTGTSGLTSHHERDAGLGHHGRDHRQGQPGFGTDESTVPHPSSQHKTLRSDDPNAINEAYRRTQPGEQRERELGQQQHYDTHGHHGHRQNDSGLGLNPTRHQEREGLSSGGEPYWGDAERTGHHDTGRHATGQHATEHHGVGGSHGRQHIPGGSGALATKELPAHPRGAHHTTGRDDLPPPTGPAVGGGVYNSVTGTGSHEDQSHRAGGSRHNPLETGATGAVGGSNSRIGESAMGGVPGEYHGQTTGSHGGPLSSHTGHTGSGHGLGHTGHTGAGHNEVGRSELDQPGTGHTGIGHSGTGHNELGQSGTGHTGIGHERGGHTGAGAAAAGIAGSEAARRHHEHQQPGYGHESGLHREQAGVPQSSLLDPHSTEPHSRKPIGTDPLRSSNDPTSQAGRSDISGPGGVGSGVGGQYHGPGHEGAKVMHKCHNCGVDNDISHYFHKGAVYRIGS